MTENSSWHLSVNSFVAVFGLVDCQIQAVLQLQDTGELIILPFQTQNFTISQILPSIDIWHLFGLISRIPGLLYSIFSVSVFF